MKYPDREIKMLFDIPCSNLTSIDSNSQSDVMYILNVMYIFYSCHTHRMALLYTVDVICSSSIK